MLYLYNLSTIACLHLEKKNKRRQDILYLNWRKKTSGSKNFSNKLFSIRALVEINHVSITKDITLKFLYAT